jgi:hypothetical protein
VDDPKLHYEHPGVVTWQMLPEWLLERVPEIRPEYEDAIEWSWMPDGILNAYAMFSTVLKPRIEELLEQENDDELKRIFDLLEYLTLNGDPSVQNELGVAMEELDLWRIWKYLGTTMRRQGFDDITWYPVHADWDPPENTHVDRDKYRARWREELEAIGGIEKLTSKWQRYINYKLILEFGIMGMEHVKPRSWSDPPTN